MTYISHVALTSHTCTIYISLKTFILYIFMTITTCIRLTKVHSKHVQGVYHCMVGY